MKSPRDHLEVFPLDLLHGGRLLAPLHLARDQLLQRAEQRLELVLLECHQHHLRLARHDGRRDRLVREQRALAEELRLRIFSR